MSMNWRIVDSDHVKRACDIVASGKHGVAVRGRGLFVVHNAVRLPAKEVARVAYLLATSKPLDAPLRFASGESILNLLRKLGCRVERAPAPAQEGEP